MNCWPTDGQVNVKSKSLCKSSDKLDLNIFWQFHKNVSQDKVVTEGQDVDKLFNCTRFSTQHVVQLHSSDVRSHKHQESVEEENSS